MMQPLPNPSITFTQPSKLIWHVWHDDKRVGTVYGDRSCGFIAVGIDSNSIGHAYFSAEAAMRAWIPALESHL